MMLPLDNGGLDVVILIITCDSIPPCPKNSSCFVTYYGVAKNTSGFQVVMSVGECKKLT
jgi:hypothetical protein